MFGERIMCFERESLPLTKKRGKGEKEIKPGLRQDFSKKHFSRPCRPWLEFQGDNEDDKE